MLRGGLVKVFLVAVAISLLLDWYVFNGLKTLTSGWKSIRLRKTVKWGYLVVSIGVTVLFVAGLGSYRTARGMTPYHEWMLSLFLTFFISKLFFVLVLFLGDLGRFFYGIIRAIGKSKRKIDGPKGKIAEPFFPSRRRFISEAAVLIAAVPFTGFLYAMLRGKYDYRLHRETLYFDDLPDAFD
jgi:hypothetical protein